MNSKERVLTSLGHREPDRVPLDYWATPEVDSLLIEKLEVANREELLQKFQVDLRYLYLDYQDEGFQRLVDNSIHKRLDNGRWVDLWGVVRKEVKWGQGQYLEVVKSPLENANSLEEIENYQFPDLDRFSYSSLMSECTRYKDYGLIYSGDRLTTRTSIFKLPFYLRGMENFLTDLMLNPQMAEALIEKLTQFFLEHNKRIFEVVGNEIDIFLLGDDFGAENALLISPRIFRKFFKPKLKELFSFPKQYGIKVALHSDGAIKELIPDLLDIGLDILNPIQPLAKDMAPEEIKKEFGKALTLHGCIDVQKLLPRSKPEEIKEKVKRYAHTLGEGGGVILAPAHNLQADIPLENIVSLYEAIN